ncbi:unnamed protein product, partial [Mesorhabditis belari]|uniref:Aquaporin n=1 Tax=Mesorhabditis belari TaxID=2138241 RepID=A0AAF3EYU0_9BILA
MAMEDFREKIVGNFRIEDKSLLRELLAEMIGTFMLVFIGTSANVQGAMPGGDAAVATIAWGIGFMFAVYLAASVSGGHLNPSISLAQLILGNLSAGRMLSYWIVQVIGAFLGAGMTWFGHFDDLRYLGSGEKEVIGGNATAGLFATYPTAHMSTWGSLFDQIIGTALLSGLVCLITDKRHKIPPGFIPPLAGTIMTMIAGTYGSNGGFAINPARDLGPRLWLLCAGYGGAAFSAHSFYFWIPLVGPIIGAIIGAWIYKVFVGLHGGMDSIEVTKSSETQKGYQEDGVLIGYTSSQGGTMSSQYGVPPPPLPQAPIPSYPTYQTPTRSFQPARDYSNPGYQRSYN